MLSPQLDPICFCHSTAYCIGLQQQQQQQSYSACAIKVLADTVVPTLAGIPAMNLNACKLTVRLPVFTRAVCGMANSRWAVCGQACTGAALMASLCCWCAQIGDPPPFSGAAESTAEAAASWRPTCTSAGASCPHPPINTPDMPNARPQCACMPGMPSRMSPFRVTATASCACATCLCYLSQSKLPADISRAMVRRQTEV